MLSVDEESSVTTRWYAEECQLEDLSFVAGERPALAEEFDVASLRENIETLSELEGELERSQRELYALEHILEKYELIEEKEHDIKVNELLLAIAKRNARKKEIAEKEKQIRIKRGRQRTIRNCWRIMRSR